MSRGDNDIWPCQMAHAGREIGVVNVGLIVRDSQSVVGKAVGDARGVDLFTVVHAEEMGVGARI